jgi:hypothetical protein
MKGRNISITFHVDVYNTRPWFQIPRSIARVLGVKSGDKIAVNISMPNGELLYHDLATLGSGTEIYHPHNGKTLAKGKEIRVTISHPPLERRCRLNSSRNQTSP